MLLFFMIFTLSSVGCDFTCLSFSGGSTVTIVFLLSLRDIGLLDLIGVCFPLVSLLYSTVLNLLLMFLKERPSVCYSINTTPES